MAVIKIVPMPGAVGDKGDPGETGPQGPQGQQGLQGPAGADALWNYNGEWSPSATYAEGDIVTYEGQTYRANAITALGVVPSDGGFDLIASKGGPGPQGPKGEADTKLVSYNAPEGTNLDLSSYELNSLITIYRDPNYDCVQGTNFFIRALKVNGTNPVQGQAYLYGIVHIPNPSYNTITVVIQKITNTYGDQDFNYFNFMTTGLPGADGSQGPQGPAGNDGADALWNYTGAYSGGSAYGVGDLATYDGQLWYRKHANGGNVGDTPSEGSFWDLIAAKGEQGATGPAGTPVSGFLSPNETLSVDNLGIQIKVDPINPGYYSIHVASLVGSNTYYFTNTQIVDEFPESSSPKAKRGTLNTTTTYQKVVNAYLNPSAWPGASQVVTLADSVNEKLYRVTFASINSSTKFPVVIEKLIG
jgi:hypothetical protein